jgi:hypothetical protein
MDEKIMPVEKKIKKTEKTEIIVPKQNQESERERTFNQQSINWLVTMIVVVFGWMIASILGTVSLLGLIIWLLQKIIGV